ncbi:unnamed protein product [Symbiodinium pilosum]|uniref:Uncharacterized protein n=1 Tax=Symbiodinium pilosum TaxID=2952 RepID=A0A812JMG5_SYMPI|nr:unnamed protein product [Symbiodinium pilosum]
MFGEEMWLVPGRIPGTSRMRSTSTWRSRFAKACPRQRCASSVPPKRLRPLWTSLVTTKETWPCTLMAMKLTTGHTWCKQTFSFWRPAHSRGWLASSTRSVC